jgi:threonine dehydrogenase-like Zn-dependent dehydrogenase
MLKYLENLSPRVRTVKLTGDHDTMVKDLMKDSRPDAMLDLSPPAGLSSNHLKSAIVSLRKGGRASLMGGLLGDMKFPTGEIVFNDIELKGQWMYSPSVIRDLIKLIESGVLDLSKVRTVGKFDLEQWEQAFDVAANMKFDEMTVLSGWR